MKPPDTSKACPECDKPGAQGVPGSQSEGYDLICCATCGAPPGASKGIEYKHLWWCGYLCAMRHDLANDSRFRLEIYPAMREHLAAVAAELGINLESSV